MILKGSYWLVISTSSVVQYFIFQYDQLIFFILDFILLMHISVIYLGYFSKIKEIMNVNRCIILASKKAVMIKSMIMVNYYAPVYLINDPDICERCYLHDFTYLTGF